MLATGMAAGIMATGCVESESSLQYPVCDPVQQELPAATLDEESDPYYEQHTDPNWIVERYNLEFLKALGGMASPEKTPEGLIALQDVACLDLSRGIVLSPLGVEISEQLEA